MNRLTNVPHDLCFHVRYAKYVFRESLTRLTIQWARAASRCQAHHQHGGSHDHHRRSRRRKRKTIHLRLQVGCGTRCCGRLTMGPQTSLTCERQERGKWAKRKRKEQEKGKEEEGKKEKKKKKEKNINTFINDNLSHISCSKGGDSFFEEALKLVFDSNDTKTVLSCAPGPVPWLFVLK